MLQQLEALISALIGQSSAFGTAVLTSEHLLKILDLFRGHRKVVLCKVSQRGERECVYYTVIHSTMLYYTVLYCTVFYSVL